MDIHKRYNKCIELSLKFCTCEILLRTFIHLSFWSINALFCPYGLFGFPENFEIHYFANEGNKQTKHFCKKANRILYKDVNYCYLNN